MHDNHAVELYDYVEGQYWCIFDSYEDVHKRVEWRHRPMAIKRYNISITPQTTSFFQNAINIIKAWLNIQ